MILKGDYHAHMNGNGPNGRWWNVKFICENAIKLGYNTVYLGCHDFVGIEFKSRVEDEYHLNVIPGAEITTTAGHLLVYNITSIPKEAFANNHNPLNIYEAVKIFKGIGGKLVMAHPYQFNKWCSYPDGFEKIANEIDGAELRNYKAFLREGITEFSWIKQYPHLKLFSSSDCHPWEGDIIPEGYFTEVESEWFGK